MPLRRLSRAAVVCVLAAVPALGAAGCEEGAEKEPAREGIAVELGGLEYNVYITRQLNLRDAEDRGYYRGPDAPPGSAYYGVFLKVCNTGADARPAAADFKVVDTQGNEFEPVELARDNLFAYRPRELAPDDCIPESGSIADSAPTAGALLLFRLPLDAAENRPLELEIRGPLDALAGKRAEKRIELDI